MDARIAILGGRESFDTQNIHVSLASQQNAKEFGIELLNSSRHLMIKLESESDGTPYIRLQSRKAIKEPYTDILVLLEWPKGTIYREYAILLDVKRVFNQQTIAQARSPAVSLQASKQRPNKKIPPSRSVKGAYRVKIGDTFSAIVSNVAKERNMLRKQVSSWLLENNAHAFINGDINKLAAGVTLNLPVSNDVLTSRPIKKPYSKPSSSNHKVSSHTDSTLSKNATALKGRVKLSNSGSASAVSTTTLSAHDDIEKINERFDGTQEMLSLVLKENQELKKRIEKIESSNYINTLKELIYVQNKQIKVLKKDLKVKNKSLNLNYKPENADELELKANNDLNKELGRVEPSEAEERSGGIPIADSADSQYRVHWIIYVLSIVVAAGIAFLVSYRLLKGQDSEIEERYSDDGDDDSQSIDDAVDSGFDSLYSKAENRKRHEDKGETTIDSRQTLMDRLESQKQEELKAKFGKEKYSLLSKDETVSTPIVPDFSPENESDTPLSVGEDIIRDLEMNKVNDLESDFEDEVNEVLSMADIYLHAGKYDDAIEILQAQLNNEFDERLNKALEDAKMKKSNGC